MNWLDVFTANVAFYTTGHNRFPGTLRDAWTLRIAWPKSPAQIELEKMLHEAKARLFLHALERARAVGEVGEADYWTLRLELENDQV